MRTLKLDDLFTQDTSETSNDQAAWRAVLILSLAGMAMVAGALVCFDIYTEEHIKPLMEAIITPSKH